VAAAERNLVAHPAEHVELPERVEAGAIGGDRPRFVGEPGDRFAPSIRDRANRSRRVAIEMNVVEQRARLIERATAMRTSWFAARARDIRLSRTGSPNRPPPPRIEALLHHGHAIGALDGRRLEDRRGVGLPQRARRQRQGEHGDQAKAREARQEMLGTS
jgi:hypothetical protein